MALQRITASIPAWNRTTPKTPEPLVLFQCMTARNLAGFVFPRQASEEERSAVEGRIRSALSQVSGLPEGQYYAASEMDDAGMRMLAERWVVPVEFLGAPGPRGVFATDDHALAVIVNMSEHLVLRALSNHQSCEDLWRTVDALDSALGETLDFAYHERLGYLQSSLKLVGAGLKINALLHLPGLAMLHGETAVAREMETRGLLLRGISLGEPHTGISHQGFQGLPGGPAAEIEPLPMQSLYLDMMGGLQVEPRATVGNLFVLSNRDTLGVSEEQIYVQMEQAVAAVLQEEDNAREQLLDDQRVFLMDGIGRALGIAQSARLLGLREAFRLASMIRLASALGLLTGCNRNALNQALIECQQAHLQYLRDFPPDPRSLAGERARMFRALFAGTTMN